MRPTHPFFTSIAATMLTATSLTMPLAAQQRPASALRVVGNDPTHVVAGTGHLPDGWMLRFDPPVARAGRPAPTAPRMTDVRVERLGDALHFQSGPAAIYYRAATPVRGEYTVSATFSQSHNMAHEAYGLIVGGDALQEPTERYLYFVVRPRDGGILVSRRTSDALPTALVPWTTESAVQREHPADGHATNRLAIRVGRDSVSFVANGRVVRTLARAEIGLDTDGFVGVRVNHNLDLRVDDFRVDPLR